MKIENIQLSQEMQQNLEHLGYKHATPIQQKVLPAILAKQDVLAKAKTGSGKTAAFGIALIETLNVKKFRVQSLVLCPTRELAQQVATELRQLAKARHNIKILQLSGGESFAKQTNSLAHQAHIVVGTPGRVLKHLHKHTLSLENLEYCVLDEADRMLDMGFIEEIEKILAFIPKNTQTLLFSATYSDEVLQISQKVQNNPLFIETTQEEHPNEVEEIFVATQEKEQILKDILAHYHPENVIIFVNTKVQADTLAQVLQQQKIDALALHGDLEQYERNDVLVQFSNKSCRVLVATDVAARGLDIKELSMVINYDVPFEKAVYTHRIGRTARAGAKGLAVNLCNTQEEILEYENATLVDADIFQEAKHFEMKPHYITLVIEGGKKDKLRAGDIVGALTKEQTLQADDIGTITIYDRQSYVAVAIDVKDKAYKKLQKDTIKGKNFSVWVL